MPIFPVKNTKGLKIGKCKLNGNIIRRKDDEIYEEQKDGSLIPISELSHWNTQIHNEAFYVTEEKIVERNQLIARTKSYGYETGR